MINKKTIVKALFCLLMLQGGIIDRSRAHNLQKQLRDKFKDVISRNAKYDPYLPQFLSYKRLDRIIHESNAKLDEMNSNRSAPSRHGNLAELTSELNGIMEQVLLLDNSSIIPSKATEKNSHRAYENKHLLDSLFNEIVDLMRPRPKSIQETVEELQNQVHQLTGEVSSVTSKLSEANRLCTTLNANITTLTAEKAKQDKSIKDLEKKLAELIQQLSDAKAAFTKAEKDIESFQKSQQELEKSNSEKDKKILDLQEKMLQRDEQTLALLQEINRLRGQA